MENTVSETATTPHKEYCHDIWHTIAVGRILLIIELIVVVYEHCIDTHVQYQRKIIMLFHSVYHTMTALNL